MDDYEEAAQKDGLTEAGWGKEGGNKDVASAERGFRLILWVADNAHRMGLLKWYKEFES